MSNVVEKLIREIAKIRTSVQSLAIRGVVTLVSDKEKTQRLQAELLSDDADENIEHFQPAPISWSTEPGAEFVCLGIGADHSHKIAICANDPSKRPKSAKPNTGGMYRLGKWVVFIDDQSVVHIGAETGEQFIAMAQKTNDELDDTRKRLDDLTTAVNTLRLDFTTFANSHSHLVATAGSPAAQTGTAFPVTAPVPPVAPIQPPLGASKPVAATKGKVT